MALSFAKHFKQNGKKNLGRASTANETDEQQFLRQINDQIKIVEKVIAEDKTAPLVTKDGKQIREWNRSHWVKQEKDHTLWAGLGFPPIALEALGGNALAPFANVKEILEFFKAAREECWKDEEFSKKWSAQRKERLDALERGRAEAKAKREEKALKAA